MLSPLTPPPSHLLSGVFVDHCRAAFRDRPEEVEATLVRLFLTHWADLDAQVDEAEVDFMRSDQAGNFGEQRTWAVRGLTMFRVLAPGRTTRGVGHFIIDGASCRLVRPSFWGDLADLGDLRGWTVKRGDAAADDDSGVLSVEVLQGVYDAGYLNSPAGGGLRLLDVRDPRRGTASTGWTVNVGDRKGTVFARIYDKHAEVLAKQGKQVAALVPAGRVRLEVEMKAVKGGPAIPWVFFREPAGYLAAHSALFASRAGGAAPRPLGRAARDQKEAELMVVLGHCRNSYGAAIEQAFWAFGGDAEAALVLMDLLRRPGAAPAVPGVSEVAGGGVPDREFIA